MTEPPRDRLRELLDAVLDEDNPRLDDMARDVYSSPWHFARQFARGTGESPVALRRRVMLERAAWQLREGSSVTDAAFAAGYDSVDGFGRAFARAYGRPPSATPGPTPARRERRAGDHWLPAPNGIHFHPPMHLWVTDDEPERPGMQVTSLMIHHDLDDTRALLRLAADLDDDAYRATRMPGLTVIGWEGPVASIAAVLERLVWSKEVWLAAMEGTDQPARGADDIATLTGRLDAAGERWLGVLGDIERRDGWSDRFVDALCEPPESFVVGSVVAHVLTFAAQHRFVARHLLRDAGVDPGDGDPITWLRGDDS